MTPIHRPRFLRTVLLLLWFIPFGGGLRPDTPSQESTQTILKCSRAVISLLSEAEKQAYLNQPLTPAPKQKSKPFDSLAARLSHDRREFCRYFIGRFDVDRLRRLCQLLSLNPRGDKQVLHDRLLRYIGIHTIRTIQGKTPEKSQGDRITLEHADEGKYLQYKKGEKTISVYGKVRLRYRQIELEADSIIINVDTKEIMGKGNIVFKQQNTIIHGEKFIYNTTAQVGLIYKGRSAFGKFHYSGRKIKRLEENKFIVNDGRFSTCDKERPHYYIKSPKLWILLDDVIVAKEPTFYVGETPLFWFPFGLYPRRSAGWFIEFGNRDYDGTYLQSSTRLGWLKNAALLFHLDGYQRLGEMAGLEYRRVSKDKKAKINMAAFAADGKKIFYNPLAGGYSNIESGGPNQAQHYWRYKWLLQGIFQLAKQVNLTTNHNYPSDNRFDAEFVKPRLQNYPEITNKQLADTIGSDVKFNLGFEGTQVSVSGDWNFKWAHSYFTDEYYLHDVTKPAIKLSNTSQLLSSLFAEENPLHDLRLNSSLQFSNKAYYEINEELSRQTFLTTAMTGLSMPLTFIPLTTHRKQYDLLRSTTSINLGLQEEWDRTSPDGTYLSTGLRSYGYYQFNETIKLGSPYHYLNTHYTIQQKLISGPPDANYNFLAHTVRWSLVSRLYSFLLQRDIARLTANTGINLMDLTVRPSEFSDEDINPLSLNVTLSPLKPLQLTSSYRYQFDSQNPQYFKQAATFNIANIFPISEAKFSSMNMNGSFDWNFTNEKQSRFIFHFATQIWLHHYWRLEMGTHSVNERVYRYDKATAAKFGEPWRNVWQDLAASFNFFNPRARHETFFKLNDIYVRLFHDLHCWQMNTSWQLMKRHLYDANGLYLPYWEHVITVGFSLKGFSDFGFPKQRISIPTIQVQGRENTVNAEFFE